MIRLDRYWFKRDNRPTYYLDLICFELHRGSGKKAKVEEMYYQRP